MKQGLVERYQQALGTNLVALAFFGSCARGDETEWSDIDILLIAENLPAHPLERLYFIYRPIKEPNWTSKVKSERPIAILARTKKEFTADVTPLHLDLAEDAEVFYDPEGFLREKLSRVRELIEEAGLERRRIGESLFWWWKKGMQPRPGTWAITWEGFKGER